MRLSALSFLLAASAALTQAVTTEHGNRSVFSSQAGSTQTVGFNSIPLSADGEAYLGNHYTAGIATFTLGNPAYAGDDSLFAFSAAKYDTPSAGGTYLNNNGAPSLETPYVVNLAITFSQPVYALGLNFGHLFSIFGNEVGFIVDGMDFGKKSLSTELGFNPQGTWSFFGVTSTTGFSSFVIRDFTGALMVDDVAFSTKKVSNPGNAVPDQGLTLGLLAGSIVLLGLVRRRII